jgi:hypothetical protein
MASCRQTMSFSSPLNSTLQKAPRSSEHGAFFIGSFLAQRYPQPALRSADDSVRPYNHRLKLIPASEPASSICFATREDGNLSVRIGFQHS